MGGSKAGEGGAGQWRRWRVADRRRWDAAVKALGGSVLQSWAWGEWYREDGFLVERVRVEGPGGTGLAQVLVWPHWRPATAHLPWGPVLGGDGPAVAHELFAALDEARPARTCLTRVSTRPWQRNWRR